MFKPHLLLLSTITLVSSASISLLPEHVTISKPQGIINPETLKNYHQTVPEATSMVIQFGNITEIEPKTFSKFPKLKKLTLADNSMPKKITNDMFLDSHLNFLAVVNNVPGIIEEGAFNNLPNLKTLHVHRQPVTFLNNGTFMGTFNLREVQMKFCQIKSIENLSVLKGLETLDLENNELTQLNPENFKGLTELKVLNLKGNKLRKLEDIFGEIPSLEILNLENNPIENIHLNEVRKSLRVRIAGTKLSEEKISTLRDKVNLAY